MDEIQLRDAKAHLSRVLDDALSGKPAVITRHGRKQAVIISYAEYERLSRVPPLGWLLTHSPIDEDVTPERGSRPARALKDDMF
ncbi:type II toxin-antitoxin system prevent-host-death family antitoxin [Aliihoeflea aestuarii]|jgi:antitoxin Phd|uniref:type II toxin-antitoxin system Phd/YefM family antitoxin n=1 Tax=Aliihoeflea aestuarii TaxID=453840 RepID=UPI002094552F|nr:type II toxin-antitoxin system Phd/YefM family antitoxin [Aliihoeflea aestuarii]MCO6392855.1 type II toxin-antitoxin system prevent-host-death family antitoxin [Aliihoeflea aestuarii]